MRLFRIFGTVIVSSAVLSACSSIDKEKLGISSPAPDEYMVTPRAPLTLPPDYDLLPVGAENYNKQMSSDADFDEADQNLLSKISTPKTK